MFSDGMGKRKSGGRVAGVERGKSLSGKPVRNLEIEIGRWPVDRLIPSDANPRTHTPDQVAQIAASIREFGFVNPILVGADGVIIAGEGRLQAARTQGMREVPVIVLEHLSEVQRCALAIADNQLALNAGWDEELLRIQLATLNDEGFDVNLIGFDDEELARLVAAQDAAQGLTDENAVPEVPETPVSTAEDLWTLGEHKLLVGDATVAADPRRGSSCSACSSAQAGEKDRAKLSPTAGLRFCLPTNIRFLRAIRSRRSPWRLRWGSSIPIC